MAKNASLTGVEVVALAVAVLAGANWLAAEYLGYPFAYCWLTPILRPMYLEWGAVLLWLFALLTGLQLLRGHLDKGLAYALVFILIIELPRLTGMVFMPEGSCAG